MLVDLIPHYRELLNALITLVIFSLLLERGLALLFDYRGYDKFLHGKGLKTRIALLVTFGICAYYGFDIISILFQAGGDTFCFNRCSFSVSR